MIKNAFFNTIYTRLCIIYNISRTRSCATQKKYNELKQYKNVYKYFSRTIKKGGITAPKIFAFLFNYFLHMLSTSSNSLTIALSGSFVMRLTATVKIRETMNAGRSS